MKKYCVIVSVLAVTALIVVSAILPTANAFTFEYKDNYLGLLRVSANPDTAKPGSIITANITGSLINPNQSAIFQVRFYLDTTSQSGLLVGQSDLSLPTGSAANSLIDQVVIPSEALNNTYVYASISDGNRVFSKIPVALIQNPTYSDLQEEIDTLKLQIDSLTAQLEGLQGDTGDLQDQINSLQTQKADLQSQ
ncbi:MAG: hypothetical protein CW716_08675, partial [Candidatus Bathyarchaeum sp.]